MKTTVIHAGILLPESILASGFFAVFAAFVGINTVVYVALAIAKILPMVYVTDWITGRNRRTETRSIYPKSASHAVPRVSILSLRRAPLRDAMRRLGERRLNRSSPGQGEPPRSRRP
ncbi:hypothetical protein E3O19_05175 [Cryobacterium algoritolerans]|uniref:Uncharacterized protein n=1 Tax=Cryobacterium algoritolerans TaxID=1259184 RepID=A0A4R8WYQ0_9MICO|nr:hypothetical protein [Cryobacterium algoritolerans]TFC18198.1 hypothetical protein E3O19_05175 [Cryobacterium algoritolerans]